jgi:hypothetical protein
VNATLTTRSLRHVCLPLLLTLWCHAAVSAVLLHGQPYDRVLQAATATAEDGTVTLVIDAVAPVQYDWHFPTAPAKEVIVALRLIPTPRDAGGRADYREHLTVPPAARDMVRDLTFESSDGHGNFLVLHLALPATVTVAPGATAFQLRIVIHRAEGHAAPGNKGGE